MRKDTVEIGTRFGKWTVLDDLGLDSSKSRRLLCKCDCGTEKGVLYKQLKHGYSTSCGQCNTKKVYAGAVFGDWTVIKVHEHTSQAKQRFATCKCSCGNIKDVNIQKLIRGISTSCGHWRSGAKDYPRLYRVYQGMIKRCYKPNEPKYKNYGGRGIVICKEWLGEEGFKHFVEWAYNNGYDENAKFLECTLDRIDVDGNYEPSNCRWADNLTQANNRRNTIWIEYNGEKHTITEWSQITGIPRRVIESRQYRGYSVECILYSGNLKDKK